MQKAGQEQARKKKKPAASSGHRACGLVSILTPPQAACNTGSGRSLFETQCLTASNITARSPRHFRSNPQAGGQGEMAGGFVGIAPRGKKSGQARRTKTAERDAAIQVAYAEGQTQQAIADRYGLTRQTVAYILHRHRNSQ